MSLNTEGDKWIKMIGKYDAELVDNMENMKNDELKTRVIQAQHNLLVSERSRAENISLSKAKARYDDLKEPYDDAKKLQTAIIQYGLLLLEERGDTLE
jgi:hypothetical protein